MCTVYSEHGAALQLALSMHAAFVFSHTAASGQAS